MRIKLLVTVFLAMVVLATSVQVVGAAGEQTWHLLDGLYSGETADDGTEIEHHKDLFMRRAGEADSQKARCTNGKAIWWYAECAAECNLGFGSSSWTVVLCHETIKEDTTDKLLEAKIFKVEDDGSATLLASGEQPTVKDTTSTTITCASSGGQNIEKGERLALRIYPQVDEDFDIYYYEGEGSEEKNSKLQSPSSDPGYPYPELPSLLLFSTGLLALAGYVLLTKRGN
jgi:hypothetical protein